VGDDVLAGELARKAEALAQEQLKKWGFGPRVITAVLVVLTALIGGVTASRVKAIGNREAYPAVVDEVRDAERLRAANIQLDNDYKAAKGQIQQQITLLVQRAQARLGRQGLTYDFDTSVWVVAETVAGPGSASTAAVTSK
jgi:hypothetical protein